MLTMRGGYGSASMSAIEWIGASQVMRSRWSASSSSVSGVSFGSSIQASGKAVDDALVEHRVGRLVDDRARVEALEVDRVDRARRHQLGDQLLVPRARRVELEAQPRVELQAARHRGERRRLAQSQRDDEAHRLAARARAPRAASCRPGAARDRAPPTRTPTCGSSARPRAAAAAGRARAPARCSEKEAIVKLPASGSDGPGGLQDLVVLGVVGDVLADALLAAPCRRITVLLRVKSLETLACSASSA